MTTNKTLLAIIALGSVLLLSALSSVFAADVTGTLIQIINTKSPLWPSSITSTDPSGLAFLSSTQTILDCDGEIDEIEEFFTGDNLFELNLDGTLDFTHSTTNLSRTGYSNEPVGCAYKPNPDPSKDGELFTSDDDLRRVFQIRPGSDGVLFTGDDIRTSFPVSVCNSGIDAEGLAYDADTGTLFIFDGDGAEVWKVLPGLDGIFGSANGSATGETCTHFDTESFNVIDPEGGEYDPDNPGHLYIVGKKPAGGLGQLAYVTTAGTLVRRIGISTANPVKPAGLAATPKNSNIDNKTHVYIADRGIDNSTPGQNDGKIYEFSIPDITSGNQPPTVAVGLDQIVDLSSSAVLNGTVVDDGLPNPPGQLTTTWSKVSGPGTVIFGDPNAVDTTASFSASGDYVLRLTANDSVLSASDDVQISVLSPAAFFSTIYFSTVENVTLGGIISDDEDILAYNTSTKAWSQYFDGSDVGLGATDMDVDAFHLMANGDILLSFGSPTTIMIDGTATLVDDSDIVRFIPTSLGSNTAGTYQWYFDGSDVGLDTDEEDIDAIGFTTEGKLVVSLTGTSSSGGVPGLPTVQDEDLIAFTATSLGSTTSGNWAIFFDGSDVGLTLSTEDINGIWIDDINGDIYLTTTGSFSVTGMNGSIAGSGDDIFKCVPGSTGSVTECPIYEFVWDGRGSGLPSGAVVDGFHLVRSESDITPPGVVLTAPASGATVSGTVTVAANASDNIGVAGVQFKLDGANLGTEDSTSPYTIAWNTTTATAGTHTLTAVARDAAGNATTASVITVTVNNAGSGAILNFAPTADATIKAASPTLNYGAATLLEIDSSAAENFLMKFTVSGIGTRTILSAKLRLYNVNPSDKGGRFYRVADNTWSESSLNWNNAPVADTTALASLGAVAKNTWYEVDVKPLITGDGTFSLRVNSTSTDGTDYYSKEGGALAPQLVITVQ